MAVRNIVGEFENFPYRFVVWIYYEWGDKIMLRNELNEKQCNGCPEKDWLILKLNEK